MLSQLLREEIRDFKPYHANQIPCKIKLDANESPFDLPTKVREELAAMILSGSEMNLYPDTDSTELRCALAKMWNVSENMIIVGNGSDQVIQILINTFAGKGHKVLCPTPSFSMYALTTRIAGAIAVEYELKKNKEFECDIEELIETAKREEPKIIFMCTPNNPTGNVIKLSDIERVAKSCASSIIAVDEAYGEFGGDTALALLEKYENIVLLRTFSKALGLAGTRCGYSIASAEITEYMNKVRPPYNLNTFTQKVALSCLRNKTELDSCIDYLIGERNRIYEVLSTIDNIKTYPSYANFFLIEVTDAKKVADGLLAKGILVRCFGGASSISNCIRMTIGTKEQNDEFLQALKLCLI